jgi:hypothetical protein
VHNIMCIYQIIMTSFNILFCFRKFLISCVCLCIITWFFMWHTISNVAAGRLFGIPLRGTHSHAFVSSYMVRVQPFWYYDLNHFVLYFLCLLLSVLQSLGEITEKSLRKKDGSSTCVDFVSLVQKWLNKIKVASILIYSCGS